MEGFVRAVPEDTRCLRSLARESEAHWGCDTVFLETFDRLFNITEDFITEQPVYVLWDGKAPAAFWGLKPDHDGWELEYFYVAERALGTGYGRRMWLHMTGWCRAHQIQQIHFVTSPQAIGFYEKMGAALSGTSRSVIDGRKIPRFVLDVKNCIQNTECGD